ncbi:MAG: hypothetical protein ABI748_10270 [Dokdonella sp.]
MDALTSAAHGGRAVDRGDRNESNSSAISWGAIIGGAFVAASLSLILLALGSGLGLSSVSPWDGTGATAKTIGFATIVWLAIMQVVSSGLGGFVAGRLRTKWVDVHSDEVFFRDTAHGFLVWAVGVVVTAALLTSASNSLVGTTAKVAAGAGGAVAGAAGPTAMQGATEAMAGSDSRYFIDRMFRGDQSAATGGTSGAAMNAGGAGPSPGDVQIRGEIGRIFAIGTQDGTLGAADRSYVTQVIASRTGLSPADAEKRLDEATTQMKVAREKTLATVDSARKAAAYVSLWLVVSFLIGAFAASIAATIGGRMRDQMSAMPRPI